MTAVRWTNDVSSDDTDGATGPPALPMGTSTMAEGRGRRSRLAVDVGSISALRSRLGIIVRVRSAHRSLPPPRPNSH